MNDDPLIQRLDELERTYAPQQLSPDDEAYVQPETNSGAAGASTLLEPPAAAPVANLGTAPSAAAAPPNIGHEEHGGTPGDPNTEARNPLD